MARKALRVSIIEEIHRFKSLGLSERAIARALKVHRSTVKKYMQGELGLFLVERQQESSWTNNVDWGEVRAEIQKGVPVNVLWEELSESGKVPVQYAGFWKQFRHRYPELSKSMHRVFEAGSRGEIDYCDGIEILDPVTGEIKSTQLFVGVLCHSRYTFAEFTWSQKTEDFLSSHVNMLEFFGGSPQVISPDNLKSAVSKSHRYDPVTNQSYSRLASHYDFAVVPARVRKPKDKAIVERTIQIFQRWFYFRVRNQTFTSLQELNLILREYLVKFNQKNHRIFRCSREEMFLNEKEALKPLPQTPYEVSVHKTAKLHEDCHLVFDSNYYSAPYLLRGKVLDVWSTAKSIEIYSEGNRVAFHSRCPGHGRFRTKIEHYPPEHRAYAETTPQYLINQAEKIGPHTKDLVKALLSESHPLRHLRRLLGIVRLAKQYSTEEMEKACGMANQFGNRTYPFIERLLKNKSFMSSTQSKKVCRKPNPHLRGSELFH